MLTDTERLKLIASALQLGRHEVARAATLGGIATSSSRADGWLRGRGSTRARSSNHGETLYRDREITAEEFDAFLRGLRPVLDEIDQP